MLYATTRLPQHLVPNAVCSPRPKQRDCLPFIFAGSGVDIFNMGANRKVGCPQDPRPVLSSKACSYAAYVLVAFSFGCAVDRDSVPQQNTFFIRATGARRIPVLLAVTVS